MKYIKFLFAIGLFSLGFGLGGCFWLSQPPPVQATLIFSDLVGPVGRQGEVKVSATRMPGGGLAGLVVGFSADGLKYDATQFQVTEVQGLNGFQILAWATFDAGGGWRELRFVAVNPTGGVEEGDVALILGDRLGGANFAFQLQKVNLQLMDAGGNIIPSTAYSVNVGQAPPYYVKGGE